MKSKKFVLEGLALLAVTMVLLPLSGCKNDTVSEGVQPTNWLTFTAEGEQSLIIGASGNMEIPDLMEYSTDGGTSWYKPEVGTPISFGNETKLYLRAKSSIGTAEDPFAYLEFQFETEVKVACSGDIRTLVDYTNPTGADTYNARFCYLFVNCSQLTQAPELPAEILADGCYVGMFLGCTSLTEAPELPAEILADGCYEGMFNGCTSLTQAPELPAETLADNCYAGMFLGCTSLTEAPELPAETLAGMCYRNMFLGCGNLSSVTMLATDVSAFDALFSWLTRTAVRGTLYVANEGMIIDPTIRGSLPSGWTVEVAATN